MGEVVAALKTAGIIPVGLPEEIELAIASIVAQSVEKVLAKHFADPAFGQKMIAWQAQADAAKGGTDDDKAKVSSALVQLMGS